MSAASDVEIAWAAGLFEGEGCIGIQRFTNRTSVLVCVSSTDLDVLERFHRIVGCGTINLVKSKRPAHHKPLYEWRAGKREDVERIIGDLFWHYLGERRRATAIDVLAQVTPKLPTDRCRRGHVYKPGSHWLIRGKRICKICQTQRVAGTLQPL